MKRFPIVLTCLFASHAICGAAAIYYYSHPYYSSSDSPFYQGIVDGAIYLEDFEDYHLNTPHVTSTGGGWVADSPNLSVDGDDGVLNGTTSGGGCWTLRPSDRIAPEFTFSRNQDGLLPTYVGLVLLRGDTTTVGPDLYSQIFVYDESGMEVTLGEWDVIVPRIPPDSPPGSSFGDRFAGIYLPEGVSRIKINWPLIDHLQYGYAIPEPSAAGLLAVAGCFGLAARRRRAPHL